MGIVIIQNKKQTYIQIFDKLQISFYKYRYRLLIDFKNFLFKTQGNIIVHK